MAPKNEIPSLFYRFLSAGLLSFLVLSAGAAGWGCGTGARGSGFATAGDDGGDTGGGFGDGGTTGGSGGDAAPPPSIQGLASIVLSPPTTMLTLQYPVAAPGASTQLKAEGTFQDNHTQDVTGAVGWVISPSNIASVGGGTFSSLAPGVFTITAVAGTVMSNSVTVTVKLTGSVVGTGATQKDLDGTPGGSAGPKVVYPLDGALFPYQLGPIEFQVVPTDPTQTEARIAFEGDNIDLKVYEPCVPIPMPTIPNACSITVPSNLEQALDGASEGTNFTETVRLSAPGGGLLAESAPLGARWSSVPLKGGLYYWSATSASSSETYIMRYDLDTPGMPPQQYFANMVAGGMSDEQLMDPPASSNSTACFGCHAVSLDGKKMGLSFGGSAPALFALIDVASKKSTATRLFGSDPNPGMPFAAFTTFSPDGTMVLQSVGGKLMLRTADANLTTVASNLFANTINESATTPYWSAKNDLIVFTGWTPNVGTMGPGCLAGACTSVTDPTNTNGDETDDAEIWAVPVMSYTTFGTPTLLVPKDPAQMHTEHYPAISDDSALVVFNESSCNGPAAPLGEGYGAFPCDGYDDPSATLRLVLAKGGQPVTLNKASQNDNWSNSWPRFAPQHGSFQGKNLYWVAFSSRLPYGATLPGTNNPAMVDTHPQLWFAAVVLDPSTGTLSADPSYAPVWMPQQNPGGTRGNHTPEWVTKAVAVVY